MASKPSFFPTIPRSYYVGPGKWFSETNEGFEKVDRVFKIFEHTAKAVINVKALQRIEASPVEKNIATIADTTGAAVSVFRIFFSLEELFTGKFFFKLDGATGEFEREKPPTEITHPYDKNKTLLRVWDTSSPKVFRSPTNLAFKISLLIGRIFSFIGYIGRLGVAELGKHAKWIGAVTVGAFIVVSTTWFAYSVEGALSEGNTSPLGKRIADVLSGFVDLVTDFGSSITSAASHPIAGIVIGGITVLGSIGFLLKEAYYYDHFDGAQDGVDSSGI